MKYRTKIDLLIRITLLITMLVFVPLFFVVPPEEIYILAISTVVMAIVILPLFKAYYELADTDLIISVYGFKKRIKYDSIKSIRMCENWYSSSSMSKERIEVVQHHKRKLLGTIYISPQNREDFFLDLKRRCLNLDVNSINVNLDLWND